MKVLRSARDTRCKLVKTCDYFEWVDCSFRNKVWSMVVALLVKNEILVEEIVLHKMKQERDGHIQGARKLKKKNSIMKMELGEYRIRERMIIVRLRSISC